MNIYIIDDEPKIRRGLAHLISTYRPSWPVPHTAGDAETALHDPFFWSADLLLLDIQLPGISGLELLGEIQGQRQETMQVVIISGYAEFSFAQKAIQMGVSAYLLKPIAVKKVYEVVDNAEAKWQQLQEEAVLMASIHENLCTLQRRFFADILFGSVPLSTAAYTDKMAELQIKDQPFLLCCCRENGHPESDVQPCGLLTPYLTQGEEVFLLQQDGLLVYLFLAPTERLIHIQRHLLEDSNLPPSFSSTIFPALSALPDVLPKARRMIFSAKALDSSHLSNDKTAYIDGFIEGICSYILIIQKVVLFIVDNYCSALELSTVANYVHLHKNYLSDLFKRETGVNLSNFITDYRIYSAKKMLRETNEKIITVARSVGFNDDHYFSQVFSKRVGMTPKQYRTTFADNGLNAGNSFTTPKIIKER